MPKLIPVPDALSKPFWDAVNQKQLVLQHCAQCDRLQYPPQQACQFCSSAAGLTWKEVEGRGHIATYIVTRTAASTSACPIRTGRARPGAV